MAHLPSSATRPVVVHVGGLEGVLEDEAALAALFGRFGVVLAATLRVRREVKHGKQVTGPTAISHGRVDIPGHINLNS